MLVVDSEDSGRMPARFMRWGKPLCVITFKNRGTLCFYCMKLHEGTIRRQGITITEYKKSLGACDKLRKKHEAKVDVLVARIIAKGANHFCHLDLRVWTMSHESHNSGQ